MCDLSAPRCACPTHDPVRCVLSRYPTTRREEAEMDPCGCACHDPDDYSPDEATPDGDVLAAELADTFGPPETYHEVVRVQEREEGRRG